MSESLVVFARAPIPGHTKTRLARAVGNVAAAELAAAMLRDTLHTAQAAGYETTVAFSPVSAFEAGAHSLSGFWKGPHFAQSDGDIGARMLAAFRHEHARGCRNIVLIGSDVPDLPATILHDAFTALASHDLVFGPAHDGGFYLIGAACAVPNALFNGVVWSSNSVLETTLANAHALQLTSTQLASWRDVDEFDDLIGLQHRLSNSQSAPHTRCALKTIQTMLPPSLY